MKVYLAAPMRGYPQSNHPAIDGAVRRLRDAGHYVFSPAEQDRRNGHVPDGTDDNAYTARTLETDLLWVIRDAECVVVLPGWQKSRGANAEVATALAIGKPVRELEPFLCDENTGDITWRWQE